MNSPRCFFFVSLRSNGSAENKYTPKLTTATTTNYYVAFIYKNNVYTTKYAYVF